MEQLLRDGGDLDSMDRSLLDYNPQSSQQKQHQQMSQLTSPPSGQVRAPLNGGGVGGSGSGGNSPAGQTTGVNGELSAPVTPQTAVILSPATPPVTPATSPEGVQLPPVIKRDLVVRFSEKQQNSTHHVMAPSSTDPASGCAKQDHSHHHPPQGRGGQPLKYKDQYEAHHYSKKAARRAEVTSPCDSCDSSSYFTNPDAQRIGKNKLESTNDTPMGRSFFDMFFFCSAKKLN